MGLCGYAVTYWTSWSASDPLFTFSQVRSLSVIVCLIGPPRCSGRPCGKRQACTRAFSLEAMTSPSALALGLTRRRGDRVARGPERVTPPRTCHRLTGRRSDRGRPPPR